MVPDFSQQEAVAMVDFGSPVTLLSIVRQGQVIYSRELLFGQGSAGAQGFEESVVQHSRGQAGTDQDRAIPLKRLLAARHHLHRNLPGMVRWAALNLEIQRHVFKRIRDVLLCFKPYMQLKIGFAKARRHLKCFTDEQLIGHRYHGIYAHAQAEKRSPARVSDELAQKLLYADD